MFKIVAAAITGFVMLCVPVGDLLAEVKKPENKTIHILEFPPMMKGEFACMLVFGIEARMGVPRKKGETPL